MNKDRVKYKTQKYELSADVVDTVSTEVQDYLKALGKERSDILRIRLTVEELLLNILNSEAPVEEVSIGMGKRFGRHVFCMKYKGNPIDPTGYNEDVWSDDVMRSLGYFPSWSYKGRENNVSLIFSEKKKLGTLSVIFLAIACAVLLGVLGKSLPDSFRGNLDELLLQPLSTGFLGLMNTFTGFLIAFTICNGILGIGNSLSIGRIAGKVILRFIVISFVVCAMTVAFVIPFLGFAINDGARIDISETGEISRMLFDILPSDPIYPFSAGNTLQIIVIAIFIGIGLIAIGDKGQNVRNLVDEGTTLLQHIVSLICGFIPLFVFVMLLRQIWFGSSSVFQNSWKPLLLIVSAHLLMAAVFLLVTAAKLRWSPAKLFRCIFQPFAIAVSTASSMAALTLSMETGEKKLGIEKSMVSFAFPLGTVIFMPGSIVSFAVNICFLADVYDVDVSLSWIIMAIITISLLIIAAPPIPGAGVMVYTILFSRLGIPAEGLVFASAVEVVSDFGNTGFSVFCQLCLMAYMAKSEGRMGVKNENC